MIQNGSLYNFSSILLPFGLKNWSYWILGPILGANLTLVIWGLKPSRAYLSP
jgi:hypothetical protein